MRPHPTMYNADFTCKHCRAFVSSLKGISGVVNRNHCPYCLYSRHVDLFKPGDRLCACKALMAPVGLTRKKSTDKYARNPMGELLLVHRCESCGKLSLNRIAADDDPLKIMALIDSHSEDVHLLRLACQEQGISLLQPADRSRLVIGLYGQPADEIPEHSLSAVP